MILKMPVAIYLKTKQRSIESKYHKVAKRFVSKYELIHQKLISRLHRESTQTEFIRFKLNKLITKYTVSIESKIKSNRFIPVLSTTSTKQLNQFYPDILDWLLGRFSGETIRMVVREGKIVEKFFLTPKGNRICVKRSKLMLRLRSIPIKPFSSLNESC